jgi:hypothetical protein
MRDRSEQITNRSHAGSENHYEVNLPELLDEAAAQMLGPNRHGRKSRGRSRRRPDDLEPDSDLVFIKHTALTTAS